MLYPNPRELDSNDLEALVADHEGIRANMILSLDGATAIAGDSAPLSHASDRRIYRTLREQADAIVVGARTAEHPGYLKVSAQMVVISNTGACPSETYICVTTEKGSNRAQAKEVIVAGESSVDLPLAVAALRERGYSKLLCEGGAVLLSSMLGQHLIDDLFLTFSPMIVGNSSSRLSLPSPEAFSLVHLLEDSGYLFTRYAQTTRSPNAGQGN